MPEEPNEKDIVTNSKLYWLQPGFQSWVSVSKLITIPL